MSYVQRRLKSLHDQKAKRIALLERIKEEFDDALEALEQFDAKHPAKVLIQTRRLDLDAHINVQYEHYNKLRQYLRLPNVSEHAQFLLRHAGPE